MASVNPLEVRDLSFRYGGGQKVLGGLTFAMSPGDLVGIIGPNGAGKTTLVKLINGLIRPQMGEIVLFGRDLQSFPRRQLALKMAVVHQIHEFFFPFSVEEIISMGRWPHLQPGGWLRKVDRKIIEEVMARTDIAGLRKRGLADLSGGERQRVMVARALAQEADILILDEPVAHLDIRHQLNLLELIRSINIQEGKNVVLVIHDLNLAALFCRRLILLNRGKLAAQGSPEEVIRSEILTNVFGIEALIDRNPLTGTLRVTMAKGPREGLRGERGY